MTAIQRKPYDLGTMPLGLPMQTIDRRTVRAPWRTIFDIARRVEHWPAYLPHYRYVRFHERFDVVDGIPSRGIVEMSANRPFGPLGWPTWWKSEMLVDFQKPSIRFFHIGGVTRGMDVEWTFTPAGDATEVEILHVWAGPPIPVFGLFAATAVIGPVFVHGIASRTLEGLATIAERGSHTRIATDKGV
ncbi:MAG: SRPBCC family protein [Gemmatimonadaceae bacterium]|nr:SRPBCC family protein [Gemmatimonadaceae bacterium]